MRAVSRRSLLSSAARLAAAGLLALAAGTAQAAKPVPPPPTPMPPAIGGTIYFAVDGGIYSIRPDGTGLTAVPLNVPAGWEINGSSVCPSHKTYNGDRWFLVVASKPEWTDSISPGTSFRYAEIFAVQPTTGTWVQLTNFGKVSDDTKCVQAGYTGVTWSNDGNDSFLCFNIRVRLNVETATKELLVKLPVTGAEITPAFVPVTADDPRLQIVRDNFNLWNSYEPVTWSKDGTKCFYQTLGIERRDMTLPLGQSGSVVQIVFSANSPSNGPSCSPAADKLAYQVGGASSLTVTDFNGVFQGTVNVEGDHYELRPRWSPDGSQMAVVALRQVKTKGQMRDEWYIHRIESRTGVTLGYVNLTPGFDKYAGKNVLGWRN